MSDNSSDGEKASGNDVGKNSDHRGSKNEARKSFCARVPPELTMTRIKVQHPAWTANHGFSVAGGGSTLYIYGGMSTENGVLANTLMQFNVHTRKVRKLSGKGSSSPLVRAGGSLNLVPGSQSGVAGVAGNCLVLYGGRTLTTFMNDTWVYDLSASKWHCIDVTSSTPSSRNYHSSTVDDKGRVIIFGGYSENRIQGDMYRYDNGKWIELNWKEGESPKPRAGHSMVIQPPSKANKSIVAIVFGGDKGSLTNELWIYKFKSREWFQERYAQGTPPTPRYKHSAAFAFNKMWIIGGLTPTMFSEAYNDEIHAYDMLFNTWFRIMLANTDIPPHLGDIGSACFLQREESLMLALGASAKSNDLEVLKLTPLIGLSHLEGVHKKLKDIQNIVSKLEKKYASIEVTQNTIVGELNGYYEATEKGRSTVESIKARHKELSECFTQIKDDNETLNELGVEVTGRSKPLLELQTHIKKLKENIEKTTPRLEAALKNLEDCADLRSVSLLVHKLEKLL